MKTLRVQIPDSDWTRMKSCISHHGEISFILRKAIREYLKEKGRELKGSVAELTGLYSEMGELHATKRDRRTSSRRRRGTTKAKVNLGRGESG